MSRILNQLEEIGAITRIRKGRLKIITINPEAAYRGDVSRHAKVVELYKLRVLDGGKTDPDPDRVAGAAATEQMDVEDYLADQEGDEGHPPPPDV